MEKAVKALFSVMPLLFGLGFIAPLIAQSMARLNWPAPFGLSELAFGLAVGGIWGLYANIKGRWV
jgi:hypothetical protein